MSDPYKVLGINKNATMDDVRTAYRKMAAKYHPDKGGDAWVFQQIQDAYQAICDSVAPEPESTAIVPVPPIPAAPSPQVNLDIHKGNARAAFKVVKKRKKRPPYELIGIILGGICAIPVGLFVVSNLRQTPSAVVEQQIERPQKPPAVNRQPTKRGAARPRPEKRNEQQQEPRQFQTLEDDPPVAGDSNKPATEPAVWQQFNGIPATLLAIDWDSLISSLPPFVPIPASPSAEGPLKSKYLQIEEQIVVVDFIIRFYEDELVRSDIDDVAREFINERLTFLRPHFDKYLVEKECLSVDEIKANRAKSTELINRWYQMLNTSGGNTESLAFKEAQKLIEQALEIDKVSFRADFYLGLADVFLARDFERATKRFETCVERGKRYWMLLGPSDKENLAAALINLGNLQLRKKGYLCDKTYEYWKESLKYRPIGKSLAGNVLRVCDLIRSGFLRPEGKTSKAFFEWELQLLADGTISKGDTSRGFCFGPWMPAEGEELPELLGAEEREITNTFGGQPLLDRICLECSGSGMLSCVNPKCKNGQIEKRRQKFRQLPTGHMVPFSEPYFEPCPDCGGDGLIDCLSCSNGIQN
jgi:tetratricopeptide (TPR) repeat protein